jgi:hypothetical protein
MTGPLDLGSRTALPDALRVLVEAYPRTGWRSHPNFTMLTAFWLDRHLGFRRVQALLLEESGGYLEREREPRLFGGRLMRLSTGFLSELQGHHLIEDHHYFPLLTGLDPRVAAGFELLDADHQALDGAIHALNAATDRALRALRDRDAGRGAVGALRGELAAFARLLDRHLEDEEDLVVPLILDHPEAELG